MIMVDQKQNLQSRRNQSEDKRGKIALIVVVLLFVTAEAVVNWVMM